MNQQDFSIMHGWMLGKIPDSDLCNITLAKIEMDGLTPLSFTGEQHLGEEQLRSLMEQLIATSHLQSSRIQYLGLDEMMKAYIQYTQLDQNGKFPIQKDVLTSMAAINTFFTSTLVAGRRLIESCERGLISTFGNKSSEFSAWKKLTGFLFENSLVYMLASRLRNTCEHDFLQANYTSIDEDNRTAYAVLGLDHEILGKKNIPANHPELQRFIHEAKAANVKPRINLGVFTTIFFSQVRALYFYFSFMQSIRIEELRSKTVGLLPDEDSKYCLVAKNIHKVGFPNIGLFYIHPQSETCVIDSCFNNEGLRDLLDLLEKAL